MRMSFGHSALEREDVCHQDGFWPRCVRHTSYWWTYLHVFLNDFCSGCLGLSILMSTSFNFCHIWMRHSIGVGWSSAAGNASTSKQSAYPLAVKLPTLFVMNRRDSSLVREDRCHQVGCGPGPSRCCRRNVLMSSPAIFDLDVCVFRCDEYVHRFGSLLNLGQHWSDCSSRHDCENFRATRCVNVHDQRCCACALAIPAFERANVCHQIGFCQRCARQTPYQWNLVHSRTICISDACRFSIQVTAWFKPRHVWMRHRIGVGWSSALMIASISKRSAYILDVKRWMPPSGLWTRVVTMRSPQCVVGKGNVLVCVILGSGEYTHGFVAS